MQARFFLVQSSARNLKRYSKNMDSVFYGTLIYANKQNNLLLGSSNFFNRTLVIQLQMYIFCK